MDFAERLAGRDPHLSDKSSRGNASQFFIAGELCRRGTLRLSLSGILQNVDILCSNQKGTRFAHIQVKTFVPGNRTCSVGMKAMKNVGPTFLPGQRFRYPEKNKIDISANAGRRIGSANFQIYSTKPGVGTRACSAIVFTNKFGALPM
jgi:hypothetical protein